MLANWTDPGQVSDDTGLYGEYDGLISMKSWIYTRFFVTYSDIYCIIFHFLEYSIYIMVFYNISAYSCL
ncbi:hypothetical protein CPT76_32065 [Paenibacillus sp. AR247]|nr:hypothetical protein CPT76_32065 [Paenibacillus sp. AR247]